MILVLRMVTGRFHVKQLIIIIIIKIIIIIIIITYLTKVNPSAEAVTNGCPGQLKKLTIKGKITITEQLSEKCKN